MASDVGEIFKGLRTALLADAGLTALLGAADAMYRVFPRGAVAFPILLLDTGTLNPQTQVSGTGLYRPGCTLEIFAVDPYRAQQIYSYLEANWSIPDKRAAAIDTDNYRITLLHWDNAIEGTMLRVVDTNEVVHQLVCPFRLRAVQTT